MLFSCASSLRYNLPTSENYWNSTPFLRFLSSDDLGWPQITLRLTFLKSLSLRLIILYNLPFLKKIANLTVFSRFLTSRDLENLKFAIFVRMTSFDLRWPKIKHNDDCFHCVKLHANEFLGRNLSLTWNNPIWPWRFETLDTP